MNADYDILGSDLLQQSMNPALVIPSPRHEVVKQQMQQIPFIEPKKEQKVILAPPTPKLQQQQPQQQQQQQLHQQQQQQKPENKIVFDEMQYLQPIDGKNCVEIIQTIDGASECLPKQRKIQIVKKLTAGPINDQNMTLKIQKPITGSETIMAAGTPFVINKVNGNISGAHKHDDDDDDDDIETIVSAHCGTNCFFFVSIRRHT